MSRDSVILVAGGGDAEAATREGTIFLDNGGLLLVYIHSQRIDRRIAQWESATLTR